ncbi:acyl-CoA-binding domain-containing protein 5A [Anopheles cruzii]|uniref:acyl-CoA-binding domain-containing protein 5A n=1 Tax=Anopheles cruzii TaxID=68878 RepID=UPI0022EC4DA2|nr:acyl-CoA-binding domain-containing protein 5A [Anopheles cruzii]
MSIEERFNAAVNVIRGLPKNGPYQPSNDMLLRFYSYFKQATKGKCCERKPAFWDVVNRAKWEAWNRLGEMPEEVAMQKYVDELKKIVETMSYTDTVANFMEYNMSDLDNVNINDLEMVAPEAIKKARSRPNSPLASREASPVGRLSPATPSPPPMMPVSSQPPAAALVNGHVHKPTAINGYAPQHNQHQHHNHQDHNHHHQWNGDGVNSSLPVTNGTTSSGPSELSDDEYIDTLDDEFESATVSTVFRPIEAVNHGHSYHSRLPHDLPFRASENSVHLPANGGLQNGDVSLQIARTVEQLNENVQRVLGRVSTIEQSLDALREQQQQQLVKLTTVSLRSRPVGPAWWPFSDVSPATLAFIILWPLVIHRVARWAQRKKL